MLDRRQLMLCGVAAIVPHAAAARQPNDGLLFRVAREGRPIGWHQVLVDGSEDRLTTSISIELEVRLAFVRLYSYRHRNREVWHGDRLVEFAATTDDNGELKQARAFADGDRIVVEGSAGRQVVPSDHMPTTWWSRRLTETGMWIDTQAGRLLRATVTPVGIEPVRVDGAELAADRLRLEGDIDLDIWYAGDRWVGLRFLAEADGSLIAYELVATGAAAAVIPA